LGGHVNGVAAASLDGYSEDIDGRFGRGPVPRNQIRVWRAVQDSARVLSCPAAMRNVQCAMCAQVPDRRPHKTKGLKCLSRADYVYESKNESKNESTFSAFENREDVEMNEIFRAVICGGARPKSLI